MAVGVRRLGPGDEAILTMLAEEDADFDVEGRGKPLPPLSAEAMREYLEGRSILHWVAEAHQGWRATFCVAFCASARRPLPRCCIGVRRACRRRGVGRALVHALKRLDEGA
ncbi:MAG: hypothetical protein ACLQDQ_06835 [Myxococcaceae bacterium]